LWEVRGASHADLGVGGDELEFSGANIRTTLEESRGKARGNYRSVGLVGEREGAGDWGGITADQDADGVFLLLDEAFEVGYFFGSGVNQLFGLANVEKRGGATIGERGGEAEGFATSLERIAGNFELKIVGAQSEIGSGDVGDEGDDDCAARPFGRQELSAGGRRGVAVLAPEIEVPSSGDGELTCGDFSGRNTESARGARGAKSGATKDRRILIRPHYAELGLGLEDARCRDLKIVVIFQRGQDERLELGVLEIGGPGDIAGRRCGDVGRGKTGRNAEGGRDVRCGPFVFGADVAGLEEQGAGEEERKKGVRPGSFEESAAPTALGIVVVGYPALTGWANFWRASGAHGSVSGH